MTASAWITLVVVWSVITYFTVKYFWLVLVTPPRVPGEARAHGPKVEREMGSQAPSGRRSRQ